MTMMTLVVSVLLLMACGGESDETGATNNANDNEDQETSADIPKEVISNADADPIELKDQMGLELGETGYVITQSESLPLAITLNSVETTQDIGAETKDGDEFYLVGDFTFENVGDSHLQVDKPDAAEGSEESAILNDDITKGERLGQGVWYLDEHSNIDSDNPTDTVSLDAGEAETHKIAISMRDSADEYIIYFGFYASNNRDYQNKAAWTIQPDEIDEK